MSERLTQKVALFHDGPLKGKAMDLPRSSAAPGTLLMQEPGTECTYELYAVNEDEHLLAYRLVEPEPTSA